jgi:hypothetical protein
VIITVVGKHLNNPTTTAACNAPRAPVSICEYTFGLAGISGARH